MFCEAKPLSLSSGDVQLVPVRIQKLCPWGAARETLQRRNRPRLSEREAVKLLCVYEETLVHSGSLTAASETPGSVFTNRLFYITVMLPRDVPGLCTLASSCAAKC